MANLQSIIDEARGYRGGALPPELRRRFDTRRFRFDQAMPHGDRSTQERLGLHGTEVMSQAPSVWLDIEL